jgi:hypothetical protein
MACTFRFESNFSALFPNPLSSELGGQPAGPEAALPLPLGQLAAAMFGMFCQAGNGDLDYSAIIRMIEGN